MIIMQFLIILLVFVVFTYYSCYIPQIEQSTRTINSFIYALPPTTIVLILADALYRMRGSGGSTHSLSIKQIMIQLISNAILALADYFPEAYPKRD